MKIAIYSRKSKFTGKGESIENQINKCKDFIRFKFDVDPQNAELFIDEGFSGKNEDRPEYQKMISKIKSKEIDSVIIYQLNRLGRNARDIHNTMQMCEDLGCVIYSATEGFDSSTSFGRAIIGILASLAQLEREQIAERVKDNMYNLARMGRWLGGQSPLGFNGTREYYIDENGKQRSITKLKKNDEELKIIKAIYKKYLEEKSLSQVSKWTLTNNLKGKNGGNIDKSAINLILQNPVYVKSNQSIFNYLERKGFEVCGSPNGNGILRYGKQSKDDEYNSSIMAVASHKGIIDADDWLEVQKILKENKEKAPSIGKSKTALLTGLLKCSCGSGMQVRYGRPRIDGSKPYYYMCSLKVNSGGTRCNSKNLNGSLLEKQLVEFLKTYNIDVLITKLKELIKKDKNKPLNAIQSFDADIEKVNKEINNLLINLKQTQNQRIVKRLLNEIEILENKLEDIEKKKDSFAKDQSETVLAESDIINIVTLLNDFNTRYDNLNYDEKKKYLNRLLNSISFKDDELHIEFNIKKKLKNSIDILSKSLNKKQCQIRTLYRSYLHWCISWS